MNTFWKRLGILMIVLVGIGLLILSFIPQFKGLPLFVWILAVVVLGVAALLMSYLTLSFIYWVIVKWLIGGNIHFDVNILADDFIEILKWKWQ